MNETQPQATCWLLDIDCPKCKKHPLATDGFDIWCSAGETTCDYWMRRGYDAVRIIDNSVNFPTEDDLKFVPDNKIKYHDRI